MPRQQRIKSNSGYYHIMLRGNERNNIFKGDEDKHRFIEIMHEKKKNNRFYLHAFCLMDNHVHLLLREGMEDVAAVMKRITVSYVHYFNKKYKRVGHLFQDRFKSEAVEQDRYLLTLTRYIHQNPVKAGIVKRASDYKWSSYNSYLNNDNENCFAKMLDTDTILGFFSEDKDVAIEKYKEYMNEECDDTYIDLKDDTEIIDEKEARELFLKMLMDKGYESNNSQMAQISNDLIKEFRQKTHLSVRKIAAITGLSKDKVSKILRN
ncbi:MAG TPA: transposase [Clostridiales bacterium]|nr:transposase [Clostridiales bacterium]